MNDNTIRKVKLSNGEIYSFFDTGALRLNGDNILVTGNTLVDELILKGGLYIQEIDDVEVDEYERILVQNSATKKISGRDKNKMLEDIGGYSAHKEGDVLELKLGK